VRTSARNEHETCGPNRLAICRWRSRSIGRSNDISAHKFHLRGYAHCECAAPL
jgi:hypothetical protein